MVIEGFQRFLPIIIFDGANGVLKFQVETFDNQIHHVILWTVTLYEIVLWFCGSMCLLYNFFKFIRWLFVSKVQMCDFK